MRGFRMFFDILAVVHYDIKRKSLRPLEILNKPLKGFRIFPPFRIHFRNKKRGTFVPLFSADRTRLELATPCVTGMYSNQTELPIRLSFLTVQKYTFFQLSDKLS